MAEESPVRCGDKAAETRMVELIDTAKQERDTVGGGFEVIATGLPVGLGTYVQWDRKLDGQIAMAMMCIQAVKGVELGDGFLASQVTRVGGDGFHRMGRQRIYAFVQPLGRCPGRRRHKRGSRSSCVVAKKPCPP